MKKIDLVISRVELVLAFLSGLGLAVVMGLIAVDVFGRAVGWLSIAWTVEIAQYWLIAGTFLPAGWIYREMAHPRISLVEEVGNQMLRRIFKLVAIVLTIGACIFGLYFSIEIIQAQFERGTHVGTFIRVPRWIVLSPIAVGFAFLLYEAARASVLGEKKLIQEAA